MKDTLASPAPSASAATTPAPSKRATRKTVRQPTTTAPELRAVTSGDTLRTRKPRAIRQEVSAEAARAAQGKQLAQMKGWIDNPTLTGQERAEALAATLKGASADDLAVIHNALLVRKGPDAGRIKNGENPDEVLSADWRDGGYPYRHLMRRGTYEEYKYALQVELLKLQA